MCEHPNVCSVCGDRLIHQSQRGRHESSSAYGQHIHESYPIVFDAIDFDMAISKNMTRILRLVEHKASERPVLSPAQERILPILDKGISHAVIEGKLSPESGVFVVASTAPWEEALVRRVSARRWLGEAEPWYEHLVGDRVRAFETGLPIGVT